MSKTIIFLTLIGMIGTLIGTIGVLEYVSTNSFAMEPMIKGMDKPYEISRLFGSLVKNSSGDYLGRIDDFIIDKNGITFAIVTHGGFVGFGGKQIPVPLSACSFNEKEHKFVLDMSKEKFASAPDYKSGATLAGHEWAEETYRFFGLQPYWTEGEGEMGSSTMEKMEE